MANNTRYFVWMGTVLALILGAASHARADLVVKFT